MNRSVLSINIPKNIIQYFIGFSVYLYFYGSFNPFKLMLGLSSFLISYTAIYYYNDLMDYKSDKRSKVKRAYKDLARGDISVETAITFAFGLPIIGLLLASMVSFEYTVVLIVLLFQNFLHSSPFTKNRFKKRFNYLFINFFLMQFIKFSLGWFTFTTNMTLFPYWLITTLSLAYFFGYYVYKTDIKNIKKAMKNRLKVFIPLSVSIIVLYIVSLMIYPFKLPLLIVFPFMLLFLSMKHEKSVTNKIFGLSDMASVALAIIATGILLLNVPVISTINNNASQVFDKISNLTLSNVNNKTLNAICIINETIYSYPIRDLNELKIFNLTDKELILRNHSLN